MYSSLYIYIFLLFVTFSYVKPSSTTYFPGVRLMYTQRKCIRYSHLVPSLAPLCLQNSLNYLVNGNVAQLVSRNLMYARKTFPIPLHHHHQPVPLTPGRMGPRTHAAYTAYAKSCNQHDATGSGIHQTSQCFSTQLSSVVDHVPTGAASSCF